MAGQAQQHHAPDSIFQLIVRECAASQVVVDWVTMKWPLVVNGACGTLRALGLPQVHMPWVVLHAVCNALRMGCAAGVQCCCGGNSRAAAAAVALSQAAEGPCRVAVAAWMLLKPITLLGEEKVHCLTS